MLLPREMKSDMRKIRTKGALSLPLFRFTQRKWANLFLETGQLRIGTLFDYARNESYGDAIHDRHEGYCAFILPQHQPKAGRPVVRLTLARNNLALCFSGVYREEMFEEFGADCCLVIKDAEFFKCIDEELESEFIEPLVRHVTYLDKSRWDCMPRYEDFAGLMKDIKFQKQNEVRALWEPKKLHDIKLKIPAFTPEETVGNKFVINASEGAWYEEYVKMECDWLKPRTVFAPRAAKYCRIIDAPNYI